MAEDQEPWSVEDLRHLRGLLSAWDAYQQAVARERESHDRLMRHLVPVIRRLQRELTQP